MSATSPQPAPAAGYVVGAEMALFAVHLAVVAGFVRVLSGSWFAQLAVVVALSTIATTATRRLHLPVAVTAFSVIVLTAAITTWLYFLDTTAALLPTTTTLEALNESLRTAWLLFQDATPPAVAEPGLLVATSVALAFAVFLADWAAFRLWAPYEALVPALTLFIFCTLLGSGEHQLASALAFAATALVFLLLLRVAISARSAGWVSDDVRPGSRRSWQLGASLTVVALVVGALAGPRLPGADEEAVVSWEGRSRAEGQRVTISPLVDIQRRLVDQSDLQLFTVSSSERDYWRLTSLDTFDDGIWRSSGRYRSVSGALPRTFTSRAPTTVIDQTVQVEALSALWLPASFEPRSIDAPRDVRYHEESSTLIVDTDIDTSDGFAYRVRSERPVLTPEALSAADEPPPTEIAENYLELPAGLTPVVSATADDVAGGTTNDYEAALALQNWFRSEFTYSLDVPPGHGGDAIEEFLADRIGYCEQFAGTFAVMARSLGIPARVAVGFTPGVESSEQPGLFSVRGEHAHAWPEVWLGRYGWVGFEPTPGRGAPGAEDYTGVPEEQVASGTDGLETEEPASTTVPPVEQVAPPTTAAPDAAAPEFALDDPGGPAGSSLSRTQLIGLALAGAILAYLVLVPAALVVRRRRRIAGINNADDRIRVAWADALDALSLLGAVPATSETTSEFTGRAARRLRSDEDELHTLSVAYDALSFAPGPCNEAEAHRAEAAAQAVNSTVDRRLSATARRLRWIDPRPLVRRSVQHPDRHRVEVVR